MRPPRAGAEGSPARWSGPLLALCLLSRPTPSPAGESEALESRRFVVRYPPADRLHAEAIAAEADPLAERLARELGVSLGERGAIVLCGSGPEFDAAVGRPQPAWVVGIAQPDRNRIVLRRGSVKGLRRVTRHEVAHLLVGRALGEADAAAPRWLHEGTAKYYADDWTSADRAALAEAAGRDRPATLDELAAFSPHPEESAVAYAESYVLVEYLASLNPQQSLAPFLREVQRTGDVRRAFVRTYRLTQEEVEVGWREAVAEKTRVEPASWAVETSVFLLLVLAFGFAYLRVRRRSREIRRRMEEEELLEGLFDETRRREAFGSGPRGSDREEAP